MVSPLTESVDNNESCGRWNAPYLVRYWIILSASPGPMPGRLISASALAVFRLMQARFLFSAAVPGRFAAAILALSGVLTVSAAVPAGWRRHESPQISATTERSNMSALVIDKNFAMRRQNAKL